MCKVPSGSLIRDSEVVEVSASPTKEITAGSEETSSQRPGSQWLLTGPYHMRQETSHSGKTLG